GRFEPAQSTKTGRSRLIVLTDGCLHTLKNHKRKQDAIRAEATRWDDRDYVFTRDDGRYLNQVAVSTRLKADIEASGITPALTLHGFRHTVATILMMEGVQDRAIQDLLGHSTVSTTMNMYAHVTERLRRTTSERVSALLETAPNTTTTTRRRASKTG
ncbi:MAG: tyrosine-type recombinase/integrase, partial [Thermomicrobiales bacterium]